MPEKPISSVSIIVPTLNRAGSLKKLLQSLDALEYPESVAGEILLIDNGSTDETPDVLASEQAKPRKFAFRVLEEKRKGLSNALNRGLLAASGDIIALLHDDVVAHPQWLTRLLGGYRAIRFDLFQGRVLPGVDPSGRPAASQRLRTYNIPIRNLGDRMHPIRGSVGVNMSFRRAVYEKVGFFDPRLGPGASGFSEDTEYCMRVRKAGFRIGYNPNAIVYHELSPTRYGRAYNRATHYQQGLSRSIYRKKSVLFNLLPNLAASAVRLVAYKMLRNSQKAYASEGRLMKYWGHLVGKMKMPRKGERRGQPFR